MQARRTVRDLRRHNRSVLLSRLYPGEPQSRQDLGRSTGLSAVALGAATLPVADLLARGPGPDRPAARRPA